MFCWLCSFPGQNVPVYKQRFFFSFFLFFSPNLSPCNQNFMWNSSYCCCHKRRHDCHWKLCSVTTGFSNAEWTAIGFAIQNVEVVARKTFVRWKLVSQSNKTGMVPVQYSPWKDRQAHTDQWAKILSCLFKHSPIPRSYSTNLPDTLLIAKREGQPKVTLKQSALKLTSRSLIWDLFKGLEQWCWLKWHTPLLFCKAKWWYT